MKKIFLYILPVMMLFSCNENEERLPNDNLTTGSKVVGFNKEAFNFAYFQDVGTIVKKLPITLIGYGNGELPTQDIAVNFEVVADGSTAVAGEEYTLSTNTAVIKAGKNFAELPLEVNTGKLNSTQATVLKLKLTSASEGTVIAHGKENTQIKFVGCKTNLEGTYNGMVDGQVGAENIEIKKEKPNEYKAILPGVSAGGSPLWVTFTDVCGELQMTDWQFQGGYPIIDPNTGTFPKGSIEEDGTLVFPHVSLTGLGFYQDKEIKYVRQ